MRTIESLSYSTYGEHVLVRDDGRSGAPGYTGEKRLWVERTNDGHYHLCDANGSIEVQPGENVDSIVEEWEACFV